MHPSAPYPISARAQKTQLVWLTRLCACSRTTVNPRGSKKLRGLQIATESKQLRTAAQCSTRRHLPGGVNHFARTADTPFVVHIRGYGPTDSRYFNPADDPESSHKN